MIYEIGDHGGLIVMALNNEATNEVLYSWNEGEKWYSLQMDKLTRTPDQLAKSTVSSSSCLSRRPLTFSSKSKVSIFLADRLIPT